MVLTKQHHLYPLIFKLLYSNVPHDKLIKNSSITYFDFSALYINIPYGKLIKSFNELIDILS